MALHTTFRTPDEVVAILENARQTWTRLHVSLGDSESGRDWIEENMVHGVIGRSTGSIKIPLLIHNRRSLGGPGLLDHCIVRIRTSSCGPHSLATSRLPPRSDGDSSEDRTCDVAGWSNTDGGCPVRWRTSRQLRGHAKGPALGPQTRLDRTDCGVRETRSERCKSRERAPNKPSTSRRHDQNS